MTRTCLYIATFALAAGALSVGKSLRADDAQRRRPNILFIMSDDHAAHAIGAYGGRLAALNPTPNIDRLAREGMRLSNVFCTNSICVPSRASIIVAILLPAHTTGN